MTKLHTRVAHKAGTSFLLKGTIYKIDENCQVEVDDQEHVNILLKNSNWMDAADRKPVTRSKSGGFALVDSMGGVHEKDGDTHDSGNPMESKADTKGLVDDPPIPDKDDAEWADPDTRYSKEWLIACAKAYGVPRVSKKWGKDRLVEYIKKYMYDD